MGSSLLFVLKCLRFLHVDDKYLGAATLKCTDGASSCINHIALVMVHPPESEVANAIRRGKCDM